MDEREAYIVLNMMQKVGPVVVRELTNRLGSAAAILEADKAQLTSVFRVGAGTAQAVVEQRGTIDWAAEIDRAQTVGARIITQIDEEYPSQLLEIHDPPLALYVRGRFESRDKHSIAVVGTRRPSNYGKQSAELVSRQLARAGHTVVSGLATGIDTIAHTAALAAGGRTLAVIGSGLDELYPPRNAALADEIVEHGAVISEFPMGRKPDRTTFPMRNRIVSGLSRGVLIVEAGRRSGALITANQALDQGRTVFAIPGRIDTEYAQGTNDLIKAGAKLVSNVDDILSEYEFLVPGGLPQQDAAPTPALSDEEANIASLLEQGESGVDVLIRESGLPAARVNSLLLRMEMKKVVRVLPGRIVELSTALTPST